MEEQEERELSTGQAGRLIDISPGYVWRLILDGKIAARETTLGWLVPESEAVRFAEDRARRKAEREQKRERRLAEGVK